MAAEAGHFTLEDVAAGLTAKLIRRHPHIFSDTVASDSDAVLRNWELIKREEKRAAPAGGEQSSALDSVPRSMPAMLEASKLGSRAAKRGFDWPDATGLFAKLAEETGELQAELVAEDRDAMEAEYGDLLFTAVNLARHLDLDPESALRRSNAKFRNRYAVKEQSADGDEAFEALTLEAKEALWMKAKAQLTPVRS